MGDIQAIIIKGGFISVERKSISQMQTASEEQIGCENCKRLEEINKDLYEALKGTVDIIAALDGTRDTPLGRQIAKALAKVVEGK